LLCFSFFLGLERKNDSTTGISIRAYKAVEVGEKTVKDEEAKGEHERAKVKRGGGGSTRRRKLEKLNEKRSGVTKKGEI